MTDPGMRSALALAIVLIAAPSRAACPRDPLDPAAVPWIPCPVRVLPSPCLWCPAGDIRVDLTYDHATPAALGDAIAAALHAPWTIDSHTDANGAANLVAHDPHHHLWVHVTPTANGAMMHVDVSRR